MIVIFNTEQKSIIFSNNINTFLIKNRNGYNAKKWSNVNKSDNTEKWAVKLPLDIDGYKEKVELTGIELIEKLPDDWRNEEKS